MSGGVGVTPMTSMLSTLLADQSARSVTFVHACRNGRVHAFRQYADTVAAHPNVTRAVFYEALDARDRAGIDYDFEGRLDLAKISDKVIVPDADYYIMWAGAVHARAMRGLGPAWCGRGADSHRSVRFRRSTVK